MSPLSYAPKTEVHIDHKILLTWLGYQSWIMMRVSSDACHQVNWIVQLKHQYGNKDSENASDRCLTPIILAAKHFEIVGIINSQVDYPFFHLFVSHLFVSFSLFIVNERTNERTPFLQYYFYFHLSKCRRMPSISSPSRPTTIC
jgi:hypothetical protein